MTEHEARLVDELIEAYETMLATPTKGANATLARLKREWQATTKEVNRCGHKLTNL